VVTGNVADGEIRRPPDAGFGASVSVAECDDAEMQRHDAQAPEGGRQGQP
jgi:hypothetical protein